MSKIMVPRVVSDEAIEWWVEGDSFPRMRFNLVTSTLETGTGAAALTAFTASGGGLPSGGTTDQALVKHSNTDQDATWQLITPTLVGLGNVDNTSDANKPISSATATALSAKADAAATTSALAGKADAAATTAAIAAKADATATTAALAQKAPLAGPVFTGVGTIPTGWSITSPSGLVKADVGLSNVDNTSDANKPVSSAQATAIGAKVDGSYDHTISGLTATTLKTAIDELAAGTEMSALPAATVPLALTDQFPVVQGSTIGIVALSDVVNRWIAETATWKFNVATQFAVPGDVTGYLLPGTKISLNDGAVKYAQIISSANSGISVTGATTTVATSRVNKTAHGLTSFFPFVANGFANTTGITNGAVYWPVNTTTNDFQISNVAGGSAITFGGTADSGISFSTATNVIVATQSDSSFSNAVFTAPRYSYDASPPGFPQDGMPARSGPTAISFPGAARSVSPSGGVGYATGAGGTVTQATSKATAVTKNVLSGAITMNAAALAAATIVSFTFTNSSIAATDVLVLNHISGGTPGSYGLNARCGAGSATIDVRNNSAGSLSEAIVIQFVVIKGANG